MQVKWRRGKKTACPTKTSKWINNSESRSFLLVCSFWCSFTPSMPRPSHSWRQIFKLKAKFFHVHPLKIKRNTRNWSDIEKIMNERRAKNMRSLCAMLAKCRAGENKGMRVEREMNGNIWDAMISVRVAIGKWQTECTNITSELCKPCKVNISTEQVYDNSQSLKQ